MSMKKDIAALIYAPLEEEYLAVQKAFPPIDAIEGDHFSGYSVVGENCPESVVISGLEWGNEAARKCIAEALKRFNPSIVISVGIAGAISKDAKLGDVFYSKIIVDLTQRQKVSRKSGERAITTYDPKQYEAPADIVKAIDRSRISVASNSTYRQWQDGCALRNRGRLAALTKLVDGKAPSTFEIPNATNGQIASTNTVLADSNAVEDVKKCGRKMACVDTESAGLVQACEEAGVAAFMVVRGISDQADQSKALTEDEFENLFRRIAVDNAVQFLKLNFDRFIPETKKIERAAPATELELLTASIDKNEKEIRSSLSRHSIVFKTLDKEFRMPVPRVMEQFQFNQDLESAEPMPQEIEHVLANAQRVFIHVDKNYPDRSLPWLYAHLLTEANLYGRYTVPICVKEAEYGPPKNDLEAQLEARGLLALKNNAQYQLVFVMVDHNTRSRSKSKFLSDNLDRFTNASILLFSDRLEDDLFENELVSILSPKVFEIQGISFATIAQYVSSNFELPMSESETLATRLLSTFNSHRVNVHPTYLASIQKDTVTSFIEANQRGELIELAVAGIMSFLVSDDQSRVVLRRTTREQFLSRLAVEIYSEKRAFSRAELEIYVQEFADEMGFDITPSKFLELYEMNGILSFDGGRAEISVPVIKSYMLAKGLIRKPEVAQQYFDPDQEDFDYSTFDLYCEFDDDLEIFHAVKRSLDHSIAFFENKLEEYDSVVRDGRFKAHMLEKTISLEKMSEDLKQRAEKLVESTNLVDEKQAQLDIQTQVAKSQAAQKIDISDRKRFENEHRALSRFFAGALLLGASAEKLQNQKKIELINRLLRLADLVSTDILTIVSEFDPDQTREEVLAAIEETGEIKLEDEAEKEDFRDFVELVIAEWEFKRAIYPLLFMAGVMSETARTNVLLHPLKQSSPTSLLQDFYRTMWAFDLSPNTELPLVKALSRRMRRDAFLRTTFSFFSINRSYWFQGTTQRKRAVADGVNAMLKPLSQKLALKSADDKLN